MIQNFKYSLSTKIFKMENNVKSPPAILEISKKVNEDKKKIICTLQNILIFK